MPDVSGCPSIARQGLLILSDSVCLRQTERLLDSSHTSNNQQPAYCRLAGVNTRSFDPLSTASSTSSHIPHNITRLSGRSVEVGCRQFESPSCPIYSILFLFPRVRKDADYSILILCYPAENRGAENQKNFRNHWPGLVP